MMHPRTGRGLSLILFASCLAFPAGLLPAGCRSTPTIYDPSGDPLLDMRNPNLSGDERADAVGQAWAEVLGGVRDRASTRRALKDLAWSPATEESLRLACLEALLNDPDPAGEADGVRLASLMLPAEPKLSVTTLIASVAVDRGWTQVTPALVRSAVRPQPAVKDASQRPERMALRALYPDRSLETVVYEVFLNPRAYMELSEEEAAALRWDERVRADAWELLSMLDPSGASRERLLASGMERLSGSPSARFVEDLRACQNDLGCTPSTAMGLEWLARLRNSPVPEYAQANAAWWPEAAAAVRGLGAEQRRGLALRHIEPVRWAAANRPAWVRASKGELVAELSGRLDGRRATVRNVEADPVRVRGKERLRDWADAMSWGDVLAGLVIDEALAAPGVAGAVFDFAAADQRDTSTEYGGVIEEAGGSFRLVLFRPRSRDRVDDQRFVVSDDMLRYSDRSLANFHLHAQRVRNNNYAGPSDGDLDFADRSERSSIVLTSIAPDRMNVDYYLPGGAIIDLGEVVRP
jgi:hypothetical protein